MCVRCGGIDVCVCVCVCVGGGGGGGGVAMLARASDRFHLAVA